MTVSAIIPAYNAEAFLGGALDSVLNQTFPVDEVIVVDDGSTDGTAALVASYGGKVRLISQKGQGPSGARNAGVQSATSEYVAFLDADDAWSFDKIEKQVACMAAHPEAVLCYTGLLNVSDNGPSYVTPAAPLRDLAATLRSGNPNMSPSCVLVRRSVLIEAGGFNTAYRGIEDWEMWQRLIQMGSFCRVDEPLTIYRRSVTGLSADPSKMFVQARSLASSDLLTGLSGHQRWIWRRRLLSEQAYGAAMTARAAGKRRSELGYLLYSLLQWPSPFWLPIRLRSLAVTLGNLVSSSAISKSPSKHGSPGPPAKVQTVTAEKPTAAQKILRNSFWYSFETVIEAVVFLGTSIAVARAFGPERLGYFSYINFFVAVVTRTSGTGLSSATRKYMSEFLAVDRPGTARAVYHLASRYQLLGACLISGISIACVLLFGDPSYRLMSCILLVSLVPGVMSWVPAQANQALEDVAPNTVSAFGYIFSYALLIALTLFFGWGLVGIACAQLVGRSLEVLMRTIPLNKRLRGLPLDRLDDAVKLRIRDFCVQAVGIQLIASVVWDRSEMFFLKHFSTLDQIAFYSVSFTFAGNLLLFPRTFGSATGMTLMVESTRNPARTDSIVRNACRYLLLVTLPVHLGAAAIAGSALSFAYGSKYLGAISVVVVASLLSLPKGFQEIAEVMLRAADRQRGILLWYGITGVVNIALDFYLIPKYGALGAAWGNGLAQAFGIVSLWLQARRSFRFSFPFAIALRLLGASALMASLAFYIVRHVPGLAGLVLAVLAAVVSYVVLVRLVRGLQPSDRETLAPIGARLPSPLRNVYSAVLSFAAPN